MFPLGPYCTIPVIPTTPAWMTQLLGRFRWLWIHGGLEDCGIGGESDDGLFRGPTELFADPVPTSLLMYSYIGSEDIDV